MNNLSCPICGSTCKIAETQCHFCGFEDRHGIIVNWINIDDADDWLYSIIKPHRKNWELYKRNNELSANMNVIETNVLNILNDFDAKQSEKLKEHHESILSKRDIAEANILEKINNQENLIKNLQVQYNEFLDKYNDDKLVWQAEIEKQNKMIKHLQVQYEHNMKETKTMQSSKGYVFQTYPVKGDLLSFCGYDWLILNVLKSRILLLSDKVLELKTYHDCDEQITWEHSALRYYLQNEFYHKFDSQSRKMIEPVTNVNKETLWFETSGGNNTKDKIFLLSLEEVISYFGDSGQLIERPNPNTDWIYDQFNEKRIAYATNDGPPVWWWLRSPGNKNNYTTYVYNDGDICVYGNAVHNVGGVRPAFWLRWNLKN